MPLSVKNVKRNPYAIAYKLFETVHHEMGYHKHSTKYLTRKEFKALCRYYSSWMANSKYSGHYFSQRLKNPVKVIMDSGNIRPEILDCGCGFGSESIAFGLLGARATGVDLSPERINVASKRLNYYKDRCSGGMDVSFKNINILDDSIDKLFDLVFAKEFITHVYSVPRFIKFAKRVLKSDGHLIITDANPLNPIVQAVAWRAHRKGLFTAVTDPRTGKDVQYAVERLVSPLHLRSLLRQNNFKSQLFFYGVPPVPSAVIPLIRLFENKTNFPFLALYETHSVKYPHRWVSAR
jgi:2-polyprenyl-3-methyl-5-hydroxy-6-metoxy-1,4-benzoquinol methylase